jgi:hypothetical protein
VEDLEAAMRTIAVSDVKVPENHLDGLDRDASIRSLLGRRIEQSWSSGQRMVACTDVNGLAQAAHDAFYRHYPLVLGPDAVWFTIAQGFAAHVGLNAETLRKRFVKHEGKAKLVVMRADFALGRHNPWPEAFAAFSDKIAEHVGKLRDLVVADFSTTGPIERAASEVVLMDAFSPYFEYVLMAGCGIPSITLLGTVDDWRSVRRRAAMLSEFGLQDWIRALTPVLDRLVDAASGVDDRDFWRSFFRYQSGSGPAELTGWINVLFPYLKPGRRNDGALEPNPYLATWEEGFRRAEEREAKGQWLDFRDVRGPGMGLIPPGLAGAPVLLQDLATGEETELRFVAGLFGVVQDGLTRALAPEFGWAVVHDGPPIEPPRREDDPFTIMEIG